MSSGKRQLMEALSVAANMAFCVAVNAAVGLFLGKAADNWLGSSPWGVVLGILFGIIAGVRALHRRAADLEKLDFTDGKEKRNDNH